jgi:hypothetical protein
MQVFLQPISVAHGAKKGSAKIPLGSPFQLGVGAGREECKNDAPNCWSWCRERLWDPKE